MICASHYTRLINTYLITRAERSRSKLRDRLILCEWSFCCVQMRRGPDCVSDCCITITRVSDCWCATGHVNQKWLCPQTVRTWWIFSIIILSRNSERRKFRSWITSSNLSGATRSWAEDGASWRQWNVEIPAEVKAGTIRRNSKIYWANSMVRMWLKWSIRGVKIKSPN